MLDEWKISVRAEMYRYKISFNELAEKVDYSREWLSKILNSEDMNHPKYQETITKALRSIIEEKISKLKKEKADESARTLSD